MIKPSGTYLVLTPSDNAAIISGSVKENTKFTRQIMKGKELNAYLGTLPASSVEKMELFEIKQQLFMQPVTTIQVSAKQESK